MNQYSSLETLVDFFRSKYGADWDQYEATTLVIDSDVPVTQLLIDKVLLAQALKDDRDRFYDEVLFFLYSTSIINNTELDISTVPHLLSPELAYSVYIVSKLFPLDTGFSHDVKMYMTEVLKDEGFSEPVWPFTFLDKSDFSEGQTAKDTEDKARGIRTYIAYMNKLGEVSLD